MAAGIKPYCLKDISMINTTVPILLSIAFIAADVRAQTILHVGFGQTLGQDDLMSGVFNGQSFVLGANTTFEVEYGGIIAPFDVDVGATVFNMNPGSRFINVDRISGAGSGIFNVLPGAVVDHVSGATINMLGGTVQSPFQFQGPFGPIDSTPSLDMSGGSIENSIIIRNGLVSGGSLRDAWIFDDFELAGGSVGTLAHFSGDVTITGGSVDDLERNGARGTVTVLGGTLGNREERDPFAEIEFATLELHGGSIGKNFTVGRNSIVNMTGGSIASGFQILEAVDMHIAGGDIVEIIAQAGASSITMTGGNAGIIVGPLSVMAGGNIAGVATDAAHLDFSGGNIERFGKQGGSLTMTGGRIGDDARILNVNANLDGGVIGDGFTVFESRVNMTSGVIGDGLIIDEERLETIFRLSGGTIGSGIRMGRSATLELVVLSASIGGVPFELDVGESVEVNVRGGQLLEARLANGGYFDVNLQDDPAASGDFIGRKAKIIVTRAPGSPEPLPATCLAGFADPPYRLDASDLLIFAALFNAADPAADIGSSGAGSAQGAEGPDGFFDVNDILVAMLAFERGC